MKYLNLTETSPYLNTATEEYLFRQTSDEYFVLYRNEPSVIIGKHQNTLAEVNFPFLEKNKIPVIRRLSGGGAVYHDLGNLNYTFIENFKSEQQINYKKFLSPIIGFLNTLNIAAEISGKNDIRINDLKVSGNAEHIYKNRILHHGTLLFSSDLSNLRQVLSTGCNNYIDKAVKSIRSSVTNIKDFLSDIRLIDDFRDKLSEYICEKKGITDKKELKADELIRIKEIVSEKYSRWEWNFAYSPKYTFKNKIETMYGEMEINLTVEKGVIEEIRTEIVSQYQPKLEQLKSIFDNTLVKCRHRKEDIVERLCFKGDEWITENDVVGYFF